MRALTGRATSPPRLFLVALAAVLAGCGAQQHHAAAATTVAKPRPAPPKVGLRIGVVGDVAVPPVAGAVIERGAIAQVGDDPLVLLRAATPAADRIAQIAAAHPSTHFAVVGAMTDPRLKNVAGLELRDDQAARLAGLVAGVVANDEGVERPRIGWVGPEDEAGLAAFARGALAVDPQVLILHAWSANVPAACKEAALAVVERGVVAVVAPHGRCAAAAIAGAHEQNVVGMALDDFELTRIAAARVVRDAVAGIYHGGESIVFGAASGAIGIGSLDPRISPDEAVRARTMSAALGG